jgi:uncharacterized DUF497 family protein
MPSICHLIWDTWNVAHIARHNVIPEEVEEVCHGRAFFSENTYKGRLRVIGPNAAGRVLTVILAPEGEGMYYPVTARTASRKERQRYREHYRDTTP